MCIYLMLFKPRRQKKKQAASHQVLHDTVEQSEVL